MKGWDDMENTNLVGMIKKSRGDIETEMAKLKVADQAMGALLDVLGGDIKVHHTTKPRKKAGRKKRTKPNGTFRDAVRKLMQDRAPNSVTLDTLATRVHKAGWFPDLKKARQRVAIEMHQLCKSKKDKVFRVGQGRYRAKA